MDGTRRPVVVGVDGSLPGRGALRWAADEAALRGLPLRVLHAAGSADPELWAAARAMLAEAVAEARALQPGVEVSGKVIDGSPVTELCSASETAPLVVVAGRGIGGFTGLLLGSVGLQVALHASGPVVVVHDAHSWADGSGTGTSLPVLVGVDSSPESDLAIGAAFAAAQAREVAVIALRALEPPMVAHRGAVHRSKASPTATTSAEHYAVSEAVAPWREQYPDVKVDARVVGEGAAAALVAASAEAQLLIVGSRGHTSLGGLRLGATAQQLLHHGKCPIMVVRCAEDTTESGSEPAEH